MAREAIFEQLLNVSQETFAQGDYETACHSLMSALDRASYLKDAQALSSVKQLADEHLEALRQKDLPTRFAAEGSSRWQSLNSLYHSITQQATTWGQLVDHWRERRTRPYHHRSPSSPKAGTD